MILNPNLYSDLIQQLTALKYSNKKLQFVSTFLFSGNEPLVFMRSFMKEAKKFDSVQTGLLSMKI